MKNVIYYQINSLPPTDRLSPQLQSLCKVINELMNFDSDNPTNKISRDDIYDNWLQDIGQEENDKVFASYIHQLIQFSFIDRLDVKPKKVLTIDDTKKLLKKQMSLMTKEQLAELVNSL